MDFIKRVLSTVVGIFVFLVICFLFLIFIGMLFGKSTTKSADLADNTILELNLDFPVQDNGGNVKFKDYSFLDDDKNNGLYKLVNAIDYAANDSKIKGISIEGNINSAGITQLRNLREALERFKSSGKFVKAYSAVYNQSDYYLASVADSIYLNPVGHLDFKGLSTQILYLKDIQDKTGVKMDVIRMGKYKSAVEPYLENEMSDANREQILSYLNSMWKTLREDIGENRQITAAQLDTIADGLLARTPERALQVGLVDKIVYYDEYESSLKYELGLKDKDKVKRVGILSYIDQIGAQNLYKFQNDKIAVVYAQGEIRDAGGSVSIISPQEVNKALRQIQKNKNIKAVVLRVNSPGGSAMASDIIWREIENTKKLMPVIVSMGDLAASGGYYISAGADRIFAEPGTITGSIGVFGALPNFKGLTDKVGVHAQVVTTNKNSITYSPFDEMSDTQHEMILESITDIYHLFKTRVADGRNMTMEQVEEVAQGRVWTGKQALQNGLVDELGGLEDALLYAAEQAGIDNFQIREYPVFEVDLQKVLRQYGFINTKADIAKEALGEELFEIFNDIKEVTERKGVQLLLPYKIDF